MSTPPPRGFRDFLPDQKAKRRAVLDRIREVYARFGFLEIATPALLDVALLDAGLGGENDKLAFRVLKRGLDDFSGLSPQTAADLGLRFDLTLPLARFYANNRFRLPRVFRALQIGEVWRAERPQKGRFREFIQCDIDLLGLESPQAEAELLQAGLVVLDSLGLSRLRLRINDRRLLMALLNSLEMPEALWPQALIGLDKLDKLGVERVLKLAETQGWFTGKLARLLPEYANLDSRVSGKAFGDFGALVEGGLQQVFQELVDLAGALEGLGLAEVVLDPWLVRGMGYYTGPIFEIDHPDLGYSLAGGGRYDQLVARLAKAPVTACGFSIGFERILEMVKLDCDPGLRRVLVIYDRRPDPLSIMTLKAGLQELGVVGILEAKAKNLRAQLQAGANCGVYQYGFWSEDLTAKEFLARLKPMAVD